MQPPVRDPGVIRRRRQKIRVLGFILIVTALAMHIEGSPWTPLPLFTGVLVLRYGLRKNRYDPEP